jgi:uncharacterized protein YndB with AHSA1/START domain
MGQNEKITLQVRVIIRAPIGKIWKYWTTPEDIVQWNHASEDWHTVRAENDLREGGQFSSRMEAKDGSMGFDFAGVYDYINVHKQINYTLDDGRKVKVLFSRIDTDTEVVEFFEAEDSNPLKMQQDGWQSILNNFKIYAETQHQLPESGQ